jgi:capsular polysaccharide transport system ATP-binding protein
MIQFENVTKSYRVNHRPHVVLDDIDATFAAGSRVGILGANGAGKSTLLRLIAGSEAPSSGKVTRQGRISFPLGFTGTFHPLYSARENVRFLCNIYGMDHAQTAGWIEEFAELGGFFDMPVGTYSSGMAARIAFGTSFAFDFDFYLVDESIEVGDARFRRKCAQIFSQRLETASLILVSQNAGTMREYCTQGAVLHKGKLVFYPDIDEALDAYESLLRNDLEETPNGIG